MWKRRREENRQRAMEERKCFICGGFGHIVHYYRNIEEKVSIPMLSDGIEVLKNRVMNREEGSRSEVEKDRKTILREEKLKKKTVEV